MKCEIFLKIFALKLAVVEDKKRGKFYPDAVVLSCVFSFKSREALVLTSMPQRKKDHVKVGYTRFNKEWKMADKLV